MKITDSYNPGDGTPTFVDWDEKSTTTATATTTSGSGWGGTNPIAASTNSPGYSGYYTGSAASAGSFGNPGWGSNSVAATPASWEGNGPNPSDPIFGNPGILVGVAADGQIVAPVRPVHDLPAACPMCVPNRFNITGGLPEHAYKINRTFGNKRMASVRWYDPVSHTFVFTVDAYGKVMHTYSWGNTDDTTGWHMDEVEDQVAAYDAMGRGLSSWEDAGAIGDAFVREAYDALRSRHHQNFIVVWNCKNEATNLLEIARIFARDGEP